MVATDDIERAAASLLDGIPKAARLGRAAFCSQLARVLAERGILSLDDEVLCLLDRVDVVVVDGALLDHVRDEGRAAPRSAASCAASTTRARGLRHRRPGRAPRPRHRVADATSTGHIEELQLEGHVVLAIGLTGQPGLPPGRRPGRAPAGGLPAAVGRRRPVRPRARRRALWSSAPPRSRTATASRRRRSRRPGPGSAPPPGSAGSAARRAAACCRWSTAPRCWRWATASGSRRTSPRCRHAPPRGRRLARDDGRRGPPIGSTATRTGSPSASGRSGTSRRRVTPASSSERCRRWGPSSPTRSPRCSPAARPCRWRPGR
jgi:hypothetical protein